MPTATVERTFQIGDRVRVDYPHGEMLYGQDINGELGTVVNVYGLTSAPEVRLDSGIGIPRPDGSTTIKLGHGPFQLVDVEPANENGNPHFAVGDRVRWLRAGPARQREGGLGEVVESRTNDSIALVQPDNPDTINWWFNFSDLQLAPIVPDSDDEDRPFQVGDRVRTLRGGPYQEPNGGTGTIIPGREEPRYFLVRLDSGRTNDYDDGWYFRPEQLERLESEPEQRAPLQEAENPNPDRPLAVGDRVRFTRGISLDGGPQPGDTGTVESLITTDTLLIRCDNGSTNGHSAGWYIEPDGVEHFTDEPAPDWDPTNLQVGDRFILQESPEHGRLGIEASAFGQIHTVEGVGQRTVFIRTPRGGRWSVRHEMCAPPTGDTTTPDTDTTPGTIHEVELEFVLRNACTADPHSIQGYLYDWVGYAKSRAPHDHPIQKLDPDRIEVVHSERTTPEWACPDCGSTVVEAEVTLTASARTSTVLTDDGDGPYFEEVQGTSRYADWEDIETDHVEFSCGNGHHVSAQRLEDAGIDTDIEVY